VLGIAMLLLGLAAAYDHLQERGETEAHEHERLLTMSRVIQVNVEHNLASVSLALATLRAEVAAGAAGAKLNERLSALAEAMPSVRTLFVVDHGGHMLAASRAKPLGVAVSRLSREIDAPVRHDLEVKAWTFAALALTFALGLYGYQCRSRHLLRKEADTARALAASERTLRSIVDTEPECVEVLAPDTTVVQINRAGLGLVEASTPAQVLGRKMLDFVAPEHQSAFKDLNARVNRGEDGELELETIGLGGARRWVEARARSSRYNCPRRHQYESEFHSSRKAGWHLVDWLG